MFDTGSPHMFLYERAMEKLHFTDHVPPSFEILFRGMASPASISQKNIPDGRASQFHDINSLTKSRATLSADYENNEMSVTVFCVKLFGHFINLFF